MFSKKKKHETHILLPFDIIKHTVSFMTLNDIVCSFILSHDFYDKIVRYEIGKIDKIDMKISNINTEYIGNCILKQPYQLNPYFKIKIKYLEKMRNISSFRIDISNIFLTSRGYHILYDILDLLSNLKNLKKIYIYAESYTLDKYDVKHFANIKNLEHLELQNITIGCDAIEYGLFELCQSISIIDGNFEDGEMFFKHNSTVTNLFLRGNTFNDDIVECFIQSFQILNKFTLCNNTQVSDKCILKIKENEKCTVNIFYNFTQM
jgi:hypothetical protein